MQTADARLARVLMDRNVEEAGRMARAHYTEQPKPPVQPGWLPGQAYRVLGQLGAWLVALGERLEQYTPVRTSP